MLGLTLLGLVAIVLALPLAESTKHDLINLLAVLGSGALALSSTTFLSNVLAGLMLRSVRNFELGDFVRCDGHFGRVTERGLVHTEIQTEDRDLTTLPNLLLIQNPVTVVRASGTILSTQVSLGYDLSRVEIETALTAAAEAADLDEPFVQILELGDFSVTYRVAGLLQDVRQLISARSRLNAKVLDYLHDADIEIVSPTFMNTRAFGAETKVIPPTASADKDRPSEGGSVEDLAFDKADLAQSVDQLLKQEAALQAERETLGEQLKSASDPAQRDALKAAQSALDKRLEDFTTSIETRREDLASHDQDSP